MTERTLLLEARMAEAQALLRINQLRRAHAELMLALVVVVSLAVAASAVIAHRADVLLLLPPIALLLTSWSFQQYADVTVLGTARARLEGLVNEALGETALIYESHVAAIRHRPPLVGGVRVLQALARGATVGGVVVGALVAVGDSWWVAVSYGVTTLVAGISCVLSYRDMLRAAAVASDALGELGVNQL